MEKFLKIVGLIVVAWIAIGVVGWIIGVVFHTLLILAIVAGVVVGGAAIASRSRRQIGSRR